MQKRGGLARSPLTRCCREASRSSRSVRGEDPRLSERRRLPSGGAHPRLKGSPSEATRQAGEGRRTVERLRRVLSRSPAQGSPDFPRGCYGPWWAAHPVARSLPAGMPRRSPQRRGAGRARGARAVSGVRPAARAPGRLRSPGRLLLPSRTRPEPGRPRRSGVRPPGGMTPVARRVRTVRFRSPGPLRVLLPRREPRERTCAIRKTRPARYRCGPKRFDPREGH